MQAGYANKDTMSDTYNAYARQPSFEAFEGMFKVTMPNLIYQSKEQMVTEVRAYYGQDDIYARVMSMFNAKREITRQEVEQELNVSLSTATRILRSLKEQHKIRPVGRGKQTMYVKY